MHSDQAAGIFREAARLNREDPLRNGSLLKFPSYGQLVITGDLHGHRRNFERLQTYCALDRFGPRHVILHELIHEEVEGINGPDRSHELLLRAAEWKCAFPEQVHFLQSNHELAQLNGDEITKNGRPVTTVFAQSVRIAYDDDQGVVMEAILEFLRSFPLAGRTPNHVFISHSLPSPSDLPRFDTTVFARVPTANDYAERGSVHALVWGRYHTSPALETLGNLLHAEFFVCGHQPQDTGFDVQFDRLIILASNHNHGVFLPLDLSRPVTIDSLTGAIRPLAAIS